MRLPNTQPIINVDHDNTMIRFLKICDDTCVLVSVSMTKLFFSFIHFVTCDA